MNDQSRLAGRPEGFAEWLQGRIGLGRGSGAGPPFSIICRDHAHLDWSELGMEHRLPRSLSAAFAAPSRGVEVELNANLLSDSAAVEVSGVLQNNGAEPILDVSGVATIRLSLGGDADWHEPTVRSWRGARLVPNFFPPLDFEASDHVLIDMSGVITPLAVSSGSDGRSSSGDLPFLLVSGKRRGLAVAIEWSGAWFIRLKQERLAGNDESGMRVSLEAGIWGLGLALRAGESLPLPTVLLLPYEGSADDGEKALRRHIRRNVVPALAGDEVTPPTSFNHWFAFGNDVSDRLLRPAVEASARIGLEYFVVDAGWFVGGFHRGIGNWEADQKKFPSGIGAFADFVRSHGMRYGTWFEPEFAHVESALYRDHPDWFFPVGGGPCPPSFRDWLFDTELGDDLGRSLHEFRMLDFGLEHVQQYWIDRIVSAHKEWGVRWIRWDCNRSLSARWSATDEPGWAQIGHIQGLYRVWDYLLETLPDLFIEQCASGGNRIDLGTARRGHAFWMNDHSTHTDLVRRLQTRLNRILPGNYPNTNLSQTGHDFTDYDFLSHGCGPWGYSGRLWEASSRQLEGYQNAVSRFKGYRELLYGDYTFSITEPENRLGHEIHRWTTADRQLVIEFGRDAAGSATATIE